VLCDFMKFIRLLVIHVFILYNNINVLLFLEIIKLPNEIIIEIFKYVEKDYSLKYKNLLDYSNYMLSGYHIVISKINTYDPYYKFFYYLNLENCKYFLSSDSIKLFTSNNNLLIKESVMVYYSSKHFSINFNLYLPIENLDITIHKYNFKNIIKKLYGI
jgi:hypothetical protein